MNNDTQLFSSFDLQWQFAHACDLRGRLAPRASEEEKHELISILENIRELQSSERDSSSMPEMFRLCADVNAILKIQNLCIPVDDLQNEPAGHGTSLVIRNNSIQLLVGGEGVRNLNSIKGSIRVEAISSCKTTMKIDSLQVSI